MTSRTLIKARDMGAQSRLYLIYFIYFYVMQSVFEYLEKRHTIIYF